MDFTIILIFACVFLLTFLLTRKRYKLPPGPYNVPFIGSISVVRKLRSGQRPHEIFHEAGLKYGKVISLRLGRQLVVVLTGYDAVHEALVTKSQDFSDRIRIGPSSVMRRYFKGDGIIMSPYNHNWKTLRRFTLQTLRDFGVGKDSIEEKIFNEIDAVSKGFEELHGKPVDFNFFMQNLVGNVSFGIIFGKRYDYDDPEFEIVRNLTNVIVSGSGQVNTNNFVPKFITNLLSKLVQNAKEASELESNRLATLGEIRDFLGGFIRQHEETFDDNNIRDFVDLYIQTTRGDSEKDKDVFTKDNMFRVILDLFLAGSETTSTSLDWAMLFMTEHPDIQKKCQQEIEEVVGDKAVHYADRGKLKYVEATIMEIQRRSNIVPLNVPHFTSRDTTLYGYDIPERTMVIPLLYSVSLDPKYWDNPTKFNPNRFIGENGKLLKLDANIPFSTGPRMCLGEPLARMELFLVFANLLQRFTFEREDPNVKHSMESKLNQITNTPKPYKLRVIKRQ